MYLVKAHFAHRSLSIPHTHAHTRTLSASVTAASPSTATVAEPFRRPADASEAGVFVETGTNRLSDGSRARQQSLCSGRSSRRTEEHPPHGCPRLREQERSLRRGRLQLGIRPLQSTSCSGGKTVPPTVARLIIVARQRRESRRSTVEQRRSKQQLVAKERSLTFLPCVFWATRKVWFGFIITSSSTLLLLF